MCSLLCKLLGHNAKKSVEDSKKPLKGQQVDDVDINGTTSLCSNPYLIWPSHALFIYFLTHFYIFLRVYYFSYVRLTSHIDGI